MGFLRKTMGGQSAIDAARANAAKEAERVRKEADAQAAALMTQASQAALQQRLLIEREQASRILEAGPAVDAGQVDLAVGPESADSRRARRDNFFRKDFL